MTVCVCCLKPWPKPNARVDTGPIHFDCLEEHHSDPTGVWPPDHSCRVEGDDE